MEEEKKEILWTALRLSKLPGIWIWNNLRPKSDLPTEEEYHELLAVFQWDSLPPSMDGLELREVWRSALQALTHWPDRAKDYLPIAIAAMKQQDYGAFGLKSVQKVAGVALGELLEFLTDKKIQKQHYKVGEYSDQIYQLLLPHVDQLPQYLSQLESLLNQGLYAARILALKLMQPMGEAAISLYPILIQELNPEQVTPFHLQVLAEMKSKAPQTLEHLEQLPPCSPVVEMERLITQAKLDPQQIDTSIRRLIAMILSKGGSQIEPILEKLGHWRENNAELVPSLIDLARKKPTYAIQIYRQLMEWGTEWSVVEREIRYLFSLPHGYDCLNYFSTVFETDHKPAEAIPCLLQLLEFPSLKINRTALWSLIHLGEVIRPYLPQLYTALDGLPAQDRSDYLSHLQKIEGVS